VGIFQEEGQLVTQGVERAGGDRGAVQLSSDREAFSGALARARHGQGGALPAGRQGADPFRTIAGADEAITKPEFMASCLPDATSLTFEQLARGDDRITHSEWTRSGLAGQDLPCAPPSPEGGPAQRFAAIAGADGIMSEAEFKASGLAAKSKASFRSLAGAGGMDQAEYLAARLDFGAIAGRDRRIDRAEFAASSLKGDFDKLAGSDGYMTKADYDGIGAARRKGFLGTAVRVATVAVTVTGKAAGILGSVQTIIETVEAIKRQ
jgi:hypothetical protein